MPVRSALLTSLMAISFASAATTTPARPGGAASASGALTAAPVPPAATVTPILNPGQTWVMQADPARTGWPAAGVIMTLGPYRKVGAASVKFTLSARPQGAATATDDLYYDPLDSDPEFIAGTRLVTRPDRKSVV